MVFFNWATMQMAAKIVYYGPGLCGKTSNLSYIYAKTAPNSRGEMVSLETESDRTLFFDLLPIEVGTIGGFKTRLQLYTVPGQVFYNTTRKLVLKGVDGLVFVADSQRPMREANTESFSSLRDNLVELGLEFNELPLVLQYNKRDLKNVLSVEELDNDLNPDDFYPSFESSAISGFGVFETLKEITKLTLKKLRKRMAAPETVGRPKPSAAVRPSAPVTPRRPTAISAAGLARAAEEGVEDGAVAAQVSSASADATAAEDQAQLSSPQAPLQLEIPADSDAPPQPLEPEPLPSPAAAQAAATAQAVSAPAEPMEPHAGTPFPAADQALHGTDAADLEASPEPIADEVPAPELEEVVEADVAFAVDEPEAAGGEPGLEATEPEPELELELELEPVEEQPLPDIEPDAAPSPEPVISEQEPMAAREPEGVPIFESEAEPEPEVAEPEPEVVVDFEKTDVDITPPPVKTVHVSNQMDILAELDTLRKEATMSSVSRKDRTSSPELDLDSLLGGGQNRNKELRRRIAKSLNNDIFKHMHALQLAVRIQDSSGETIHILDPVSLHVERASALEKLSLQFTIDLENLQ